MKLTADYTRIAQLNENALIETWEASHDPQDLLVLADYLEEQGDPRSDVIRGYAQELPKWPGYDWTTLDQAALQSVESLRNWWVMLEFDNVMMDFDLSKLEGQGYTIGSGYELSVDELISVARDLGGEAIIQSDQAREIVDDKLILVRSAGLTAGDDEEIADRLNMDPEDVEYGQLRLN